MGQTDFWKHIVVEAAGAGWLVVNKAAGISVHNDPGRDLCAGIRTLLETDQQLAGRVGVAPGGEIHAPHRLDRDTSGLVVVCCKASALQFFGAAFREGRVVKRYLAIVHGHPESLSQEGFWSFPLARSGGGRANPSGKGKRLTSRTAFQVIRPTPHYALIACSPITGRRHQIRRHAKLAGHPVVGDRRYGSPRSLRYLRKTAGFNRLGLHAFGLDLPLPDETGRLAVVTPNLPPAMIQLLVGDSGQSAPEWETLVGQTAESKVLTGDVL